MSAITALTPNQVSDELNKMQAFIRKEAEEKAKEIQLKADQEYEIEKSSLVRNEITNIDVITAEKRKKASLQQQIMKSTVANKMRLKALLAMEEGLEDIFEAARDSLASISQDEERYKPVLVDLIVEGMLKLLEPHVIIQARESDIPLIESLIDVIQLKYKEATSKEVNITLSQEYLNKDVAGGVKITDASGRIKIDNTLEERLKLLRDSSLPGIRSTLFGVSKTRKFTD
ncbi:H(+)-transporting V1 sector ATPase subunit E Ecym_5062 [Eremothecium cymbalariae DBVPG|uniref:V-type proton ATPase subunit E n=1 Tax=Eremothecium cymbalariae (strain CBS 270.75 / DBVPG 7215 / KCTC 17166 / NRRL Y-17582) TaxID=931890 RepID=I6NCR0_ERECY|nr:hypothetical protein Ecym_5062 [Eremothecium cymbalariae DBVPG\